MISASGGHLRSSRLNSSCSACNRISSTFAGRSVSQGKIIFCHREQQKISPTFTFKTEVPLYERSAIRKLLKSTDNQFGLRCDKGWGYAIGSLPEGTSTDVYEVDFLGPSLWQLKHSNQIVMTVHQGIPNLPASETFHQEVAKILPRVFKSLTDSKLARLMEVVDAMSDVRGGGLLVISDDAAMEAERLESQGTTTVPFHVTPDIMERLSRMGGAILISPDGQCHAVGVKLDGKANRKCSASRGARYNAAVRYVCGEATSGRVAIVKSEDGMLDVLSTLHQASE